MMSLYAATVQLADASPALRPHLFEALGRTAMEHATEEAKKTYLAKHPNADPANHTVKSQKDDGEAKPEPEGDGGKGHQVHLKDLPVPQRKIVDDMPTQFMGKEEAYKHPKIKAKVKELKKLPLRTVRKLYDSLQSKMNELQGASMDAQDKAVKTSLANAANQVQCAWRATNMALSEMGTEKSERDKNPGVKSKYMSPAEAQKRREIPHDILTKLKDWSGSSKSDPIHKVIEEMKQNNLVPHEKIVKAIAHLTALANDPHHEDDKKEILELRDNLAKSTGHKAASLRASLIRLANSNPNLRPHLLPLLANKP